MVRVKSFGNFTISKYIAKSFVEVKKRIIQKQLKMKKLFFTAITLVAFSFVSSANPINENKIKNTKTFIELTKETSLVRSDGNSASTKMCEGIYGSVVIYARNHGCTADQASCIAFAALFECMGIDATEAKKKIGTLC